MKIKEEKEKEELERFIKKQHKDIEREMALKHERDMTMKEIKHQAEEKARKLNQILNKQKMDLEK